MWEKTEKYAITVMKGLRWAGQTHPTVDTGVRNNPGILISGHDLRDLEMLLEQTAGTGVDVYTHSEMLPAHYRDNSKNTPSDAS